MPTELRLVEAKVYQMLSTKIGITYGILMLPVSKLIRIFPLRPIPGCPGSGSQAESGQSMAASMALCNPQLALCSSLVETICCYCQTHNLYPVRSSGSTTVGFQACVSF